MKEEFLHYIWKTQQFNHTRLCSAEGEQIEIISPGIANENEGPDFLNARIKINDTLWAGNVEIHVYSADWHKHRHYQSKQYNNVILHVVYEHTFKESASGKIPSPVLELKGRIPHYLIERYYFFEKSKNDILCAPLLGKHKIIFPLIYESLYFARIERKLKDVNDIFNKVKGDWSHLLQVLLLRSFGFKINQQPMEALGLLASPVHLSRVSDNLQQLEALLFGLAGLLNGNPTDSYMEQLQKEYRYLKNKFNYTTEVPYFWLFAKTRPANFPTVRLAQFCALLHKHNFYAMLANPEILANRNTVYHILDAAVSDYWKNHYHFGKSYKKRRNRHTLSQASKNRIILNALVVFLFFYAEQQRNEHIKQQLVELIEKIPPETNNIIQKWVSLGIRIENQLQSQALIELYNEYCKKKKCMQCKVGHAILSADR